MLRPILPAVTSTSYTLAPFRTSAHMADARQRNNLAVLRRRHIEYISRSTEQPLFRDSQPHNYFVDEESLMGNLPFTCFEKLERSVLIRSANSFWVICRIHYQFPDSSYKYIVGHSGIFIGLSDLINITILWLYYHIFVPTKVSKEF